MNAKQEILNRIRAAGQIPAHDIARDYLCGTEASRSDIIADMVAALEDYTAIVTIVPPAGVGDAIDEMLLEADTVVVPPGLDESWRDAAGRHGRTVRIDDPPLSKADLDATDAVVTASRVGVSLSGTIILDGQPDQGRRAISLVPDTHVIVLDADDIKATVPEAVAIVEEHPLRPTTWIAGPSATSDIELVRVDGVHGPRNLRVIIVDQTLDR